MRLHFFKGCASTIVGGGWIKKEFNWHSHMVPPPRGSQLALLAQDALDCLDLAQILTV